MGSEGRRTPEVLAIVPTLDVGARRLARLLGSLDDLTGDASVRVVVVVNRGPDLPIADDGPVGSTPPRGATVVETGLNLGFAGSIDLAATMFDATHLWLLQDDLVVDPSCLSSLLAVLDRDPTLGAASPTMVDASGTVRRGHAGGVLDPDGDVVVLPAADVALEEYTPPVDLDFVMSRGLLVRSEAWRAVGGVDPRFYPVGWTDVDLCARLREHGWAFAAIAQATLQHEKSASTSRILGRTTSERNRELFRAKRNGATERPAVHPALTREALEVVAQSASALVLDLTRRADAAAEAARGRPTDRQLGSPRFLTRLLMRAMIARIRRPLRRGSGRAGA